VGKKKIILGKIVIAEGGKEFQKKKKGEKKNPEKRRCSNKK